jgi:GT2 family glycosyltransferase
MPAAPTPRMSVVIVSFRSRDPLARCLPSLARCLDRLALEVIVVDNASGDGTVQWLAAAHPWVRCVACDTNLGFTRGVNLGVAHARAAWLLVLNPDCEVSAGALARLLEVARATPRLAAVAPALHHDDGTVARSCGRFPTLWTLFCDHLGLAAAAPGSRWFGRYKYAADELERLERVDWASGAALLVPRSAWDDVGPFDEHIFMYMEEVDWCRRAAARGLHVRYVADAPIVHVGQQSSRHVPRETYLHNLRSRVYYFRKHHGPVAALGARAILATSLVLKWLVACARAGSRAAARVYASGLAVVWKEAWR